MSSSRTVLITGSTTGIGRAIADRLIAQGHLVIGLARHDGEGDPPASGYVPVRVDFADLDALPAALSAVVERFPEIDTVISNAGAGRFGNLEEFSTEQIRHMIDLNLTSHLILARAVLPSLKRRRETDLVFVGSESALRAGRKGAVYGAAKYGLRGLARALREECAKSGVRVAIVHPGMVRTAFFSDLTFEPGEAEEEALQPQDVAEVIVQILNLPFRAVVDEVALSPLKHVVRSKPDRSLT